MSLYISYLVKLSISLAIVWLFYHLLLRKLTFYGLNRWYLLGYSLLSFIIPLVNIDLFLGQDPEVQPVMIKYIPVIGNYRIAPARDGLFTAIHIGEAFSVLAALGSLFLAVRFGVRWQALRKIRRQSRLVRDAGTRIYQVDQTITPFSFGSAIYINGQQHTDDEWSAIIRHEMVHVRQKHTIDILLAELFCIVNWYNPFTWLIRHAIRQNLEFIADNCVVDSGCDKKRYQYHLLKVARQSRYSLANNFNFSSLKRRIIMMNKIRTARLHMMRFLFMVPLLAVLLAAFRSLPAAAPALRPHPSLPSVSVSFDTASGRANVTAQLKRMGDRPVAGDRLAAFDRPVDTLPKKTDTGERHVITAEKVFIAPEAIQLKGAARPLFLVDGKEMPAGWDLKSLSGDDIRSVEVLKGQQATAVYGAKGTNGVVAITTKYAAPSPMVNAVAPAPPLKVSAVPVPAVKVSAAHLAEPPVPAAPVPGAPAPAVNGTVAPAIAVNSAPVSAIAANGAAVPAPPTAPAVAARPATAPPATARPATAPPATAVPVPTAPVIRRSSADSLPPRLYIVDGVERSRKEMSKIAIDDIESINVLCDKATREKYGEKGRNGVILVTLKKH